MSITPTQVVLVLTLAVTLGFAWHAGGRDRWRSLTAGRFHRGVPWGSLVTVAVVVGFYLLAQGGLRHWSDPLVLPFVTWSYFYPTGLITAGIAHGSPEHLVGNMAGTLAFAPIAEYAWGHYPPARRDPASGGRASSEAGSGSVGGPLSRPLIRAVVVFPAALLGVAFVTAVFSLGPGLGFSGAVFAIAGFALVNYPLSTVVAVVAASALQTVYTALSQPIVRESIRTGPPRPPAWAGIGFQAHLFGFLLGVLVGLALLWHRRRRPTAERVFVAVVLLGTAQALWLLVWTGGEDVFVLYRGAGVVLVLLLSMLVAVAAAGSGRRLPRPLEGVSRVPTRRQLAVGWLALVAVGVVLGVAATIAADEPLVPSLAALVVLAALLAVPALPPVVPDRWFAGPVSRRQAAVAVLAALTVVVALPSTVVGLVVVDDAVPGSGGVEVGDYTVTYEQNVTTDQEFVVDVDEENVPEAGQSGLIVVSDDRELWTVAERREVIAHDGNATVQVGGVGWRETVRADRTGWDVVGNETAYAVDLTVDGETTRSFTTEPVRAAVEIDDRSIDVAPTEDGFELRVREDGSAVGNATIPEINGSTTVGGLEVTTEEGDDGERVLVERDDTRVTVAEREEYGSDSATDE